jgi:hypothetical protein
MGDSTKVIGQREVDRCDWLETSPVEQRERSIRDHRVGLSTMAELCARYAVSRKTEYK